MPLLAARLHALPSVPAALLLDPAAARREGGTNEAILHQFPARPPDIAQANALVGLLLALRSLAARLAGQAARVAVLARDGGGGGDLKVCYVELTRDVESKLLVLLLPGYVSDYAAAQLGQHVACTRAGVGGIGPSYGQHVLAS